MTDYQILQLNQLKQTTRLQWTLFFSAMIVVSLIYSVFMLSIGMIGLLLTAILERPSINSPKIFKLRIRKDLSQQWIQFWKSPAFWILILFFLLALFGGIYSENFAYFTRKLQLKLPFLLLPFTFFLLPKLPQRSFLGIYYLLIIVLTITCIGIGIHYLLDYKAINASLLQGQAMPTPNNHIRFSLMMAIGILSGAYLWYKKFIIRYNWERYLIGGMTIFLLFFIHILSVRSGLLVLYASSIVLLMLSIFQHQKYLFGIVGIVLIGSLPVLAYQFVPSFQAKIDYMRWDLRMQLEGSNETYSDGERILSYKVAWEIIQEHPVWGVGTGDLKQEVHQRFKEHYPSIKEPKMPHNQLLSVWAAHGFIGLVIFIIAFFTPLLYRKNYQNLFLLAFHIIIFITFIMENTLETSTGLGIYIFFLLWNLKYLEGKQLM